MINLGRCQVADCPTSIRHNKAFCVAHWKMLPYELQIDIVNAYVIGQDSGDGRPTPVWYHAVNRAATYLWKAIA